jgi:hypothetical protein
MLVRMIGSVSGHYVEPDADGNAVVRVPPQAGDVLDVDEMTAALWIAQRMAVEHKPQPTEEAATVSDARESTAAVTGKPIRR